jgi:hypothetical protein
MAPMELYTYSWNCISAKELTFTSIHCALCGVAGVAGAGTLSPALPTAALSAAPPPEPDPDPDPSLSL